MRTVLFHRTYKKFHGGQLKVWDYFNHVLASPAFTPRIGFSSRSNWDQTNPWFNAREYVVDSWRSVWPDVFFVAGRDWRMLDEHPAAAADIPVVNLVQHVRHANEESTRFEFLQRKAIRVCVSEEVAAALRETRLVRGPLIVIPNGVDLDDPPGHDALASGVDALVVALKQPEFGEELGRRLRRPDRSVDVLTARLPRPDFLARLSRARTTVFLPNQTEGFYLPALEGMALGTIVVCPDCVGNRSFCLPGHNAFRPDYALEEIVGAAESALTLPADRADELRLNARRTAEAHSLHRERKAFLDVLDDVDRLWRSGGDDGAGGRG